MCTPKRNQAIDCAKVIATIMVVFYHAMYFRLPYYIGTSIPNFYVPTFDRLIMNLCSMSIPLFFMCSGYCLLNSSSSSFSKMAKKVAYIIVLTLIWNYLTPFPYWFFITLSALYLSTPIQRYLITQKPVLYWLGVSVIFLLTHISNEVYVITKAFDFSLNWPNRIQGMYTTYSLVYFAAGYHLSQKNTTLWASISAIIAGIMLGIFDGIILSTNPDKPFDSVNGAFSCLSSLFLAFGFLSLLLHFQNHSTKVSAFFKLCSSCCLPIYILHMCIIRITSSYYSNLHTISDCNPNVYTGFIWTLFICLVCGITGYIIRKLPYIQFLMKL